MPRGGRRSGKPGGQYPNRSDLQTAPDPGAGTFKGQPYGVAQGQAQVQSATPPPGTAGPGAVAGPTPSGPAPGSFGAFNRPTERPDEPITAGLKSGPGPGPEVLGALGGNPEDADLREMAIYLPTLELMASMPGASIATRNFVRRLRGATPAKGQ